MRRWQDSRKNLGAGADAILALFQGGDPEEAEVGAIMIAEAIDCLRVIAGKPIGVGRRKGAGRG